MTIQLAQNKDITVILEIWKVGLLTIYPNMIISKEIEQLFIENFENRNFPYDFWVAKNVDETVLGWCSILPVFSHPLKKYTDAEVSTYIANEINHNGIGTHLMNHVFNEIKNTRIENVWGFANPKNVVSIRMCEKSGMHICGKTSSKVILLKEFI